MAKKLGFGLMRLPLTDPNDGGSIDIEQTKKMVDYFIEKGFTYFDTALMYCDSKSEAATKEFLTSRYPRDAYTIATKLHSMYLKKEGDPERIFKEQLERIGVEYFDYYLVHDVNSHSLDTYHKFNVFDFFIKMREEGYIKKLGFSFHDTADVLDRALTLHPEVDFVQIQLNYLDYENPAIQSKLCYETAVKHGKKVVVMEPVKGGTLANVDEKVETLFKNEDPNASIPSWAIRFAASHENVMMVLSGMSNFEQLKDNTSYMENFVPFTEKEYNLVKVAADIINNNITIPCTACSYCTEGCPMNIPIPKYFALYNTAKQDKNQDWNVQFNYYHTLGNDFGKAKDCIGCGQCESVCPQHLKIIDYLKDVDSYFG
ncbi:MAG: aldo/keto reductase [Lachnospiraceae bacterium]|nr:aldo/keto reductase [Lachnospiraceae bacterium]